MSEPLQIIVSRVMHHLREKSKKEDIFKLWKKAVGKRVAQHTKPVYFHSGVLVVNVDKTGWLYELNILKPFLFRKLKRFITNTNLKEIKFRIGEV
ncbi:MAG: DUF721 domain-containing protein [Candidatus Omnitrophica bacterium]|nr:DUF721 domain-containing protein [Candidatus Omnitrophota bacterium]MCM8792857.1 DUF721 domain-containing protein [Candidatus Omnitrophota bacterium]